MSMLKRFIRDEQGLESVEYAVLVALLLAGVITAVTTLGTTVTSKFEDVDTAMNAE